jgi:MFS family permease
MVNSGNRQRNPWLVLAFLSIPVFVGSLDLTVVSAFLPELITELELPFDTALDDAAWILTGYLLAYTISLTFMGRLSDLIGRRAVYVITLLIFVAGSVLVATAHLGPTDLLYTAYRRMGIRPDPSYVNLQVLIIGRVIQAIGAGALVPVSLAMVADLFPPERRARPLGLIGAIDTLGWVLGHLYGGIFVQFFAWQGLFWINVPITFLAMGLVLWGLRHVPQIRAPGRFDFIGAALIGSALAAMTIGLGANIDLSGATGSFEQLSPLPPYAAPLLLLALVLFVAFVAVELRVRYPLINLRMFRRRNLSSASLVNLLVGYALFIGLVSIPILVNVRLQSVSDLRSAALEVGLLLSTLTIPMAVAAIPGGWLSERIGVRNTIIGGLAVSIAGFLLIWQTWTLDTGNLTLALQMGLVGTGIGLTFSPVSAAIINSAYDEERGVASALVIILRLIGMTISVSTLTAYGLYRVTALFAASADTSALDPGVMLNSYAEATVHVLGEMGLIGAVVCLVAIGFATLITHGEIRTPERAEAPLPAPH